MTILDRGRPIARIVPAVETAGDNEEWLARLERKGTIKRGRGGPASELLLSPPPKAQASVLEALLEERREGR